MYIHLFGYFQQFVYGLFVAGGDENTFEQISSQLGSPFILKIPDGSFSFGMKKVTNETELEAALDLLFEKSSILLAQEFTPTEFDWRIGILNGEPLFACKYYMATYARNDSVSCNTGHRPVQRLRYRGRYSDYR